MDYYINPSSLTSFFTVPTAVADSHLRFASGEHIKVLLYIFKNMAEDLKETDIARACNVSEYDVKEALLYWSDCGILLPKESGIKPAASDKKVVSRAEKPTRSDVARRGNEDSKVKYLLTQTQLKFGRNLKTNETSTLVWLYDDEGLDVSLILLIVQYAVNHNKANMRFIESVAVDWIERGIDDITTADEELQKMAVSEQAFSVVSRAFGFDRRKPSSKESALSYTWIKEWGISEKMLEKAYEECINQKSKFSFPYVAKIIETWHKKGYKTVEDIEEKQKQENSPSYDIDAFEKMLHSKD